jgi:hypothetical protein
LEGVTTSPTTNEGASNCLLKGMISTNRSKEKEFEEVARDEIDEIEDPVEYHFCKGNSVNKF